MIGQEISHYRIVEKIGEGGMGVVYRAEDLILKRNVALKFLSNEALGNEEERERFLREAQAAAALDHPAICTIYEVARAEGRTFLAMAYLQGETLRKRIEKQPLDIADAVRVVAQVLEGLQEAHEEGIVHRDIKSANIMITAKGRATIMDFGLAQLPGASRITQMGTTLGTAAYMSPEQAEGAEVDHRSDLWSLGVVLYESLTGVFPFSGSYIPALMYAIVHEHPRPLESIPDAYREDLESIIAKALTKPVGERYQHAGEMLSDLNAFEQIHGLNLGSGATTAIRPRGATAAPPAIKPPPRRPVPRANSRPSRQRSPWLWIAAGAGIASIAGGLLWFTTQRDVRRAEPSVTAAHVLPPPATLGPNGEGPPLGVQPPPRQPPPDLEATSAPVDQRATGADPSAARLPGAPRRPPPPGQSKDGQPPQRLGAPQGGPNLAIGRARQMLETGGPRGVHGAVRILQREVQENPESAETHALLAKAHALEALLALTTPSDALPMAQGSADRALSLDDSSADAHLARAIALALQVRDWRGAESAFERARAATPDSADVHQYFALAYLAPQGRLDEALAEIKQAVALRPQDREIQVWLGRAHSFRGEHDEAIAVFEKAYAASNRNPPLLWGLGMAQAASGNLAAARKTFQEMTKLAIGNPYALGGAAYVEALAGELSGSRAENRRTLQSRVGSRAKGARKRLTGTQYVSPYWRAIVEVARDRKDAAFASLKEGMEQHDPFVARAKVQPELVKLRSDARFAEVLAQMNLTP